MKCLKYDPDRARQNYLKDHPELGKNKQKLDLLVYRGYFLSKNPLFIRDWKFLFKLHKDKKTDIKKIQELKGQFYKRWHINFDRGLHNLAFGFPGVVRAIDADREGAQVSLSIDLRFPKNRIMKELKVFVDKWHDYYWELEWQDFYFSYPNRKDVEDEEIERKFKNFKADQVPKVLRGNIPKDFSDWDRNLQVWTLKQEDGKTWWQIAEELNLYDIQTARNYYNAARNLIKSGVPGFPPFPQE